MYIYTYGGSQRSYISKDLCDRLKLDTRRTETLNLSTFGDRMYYKRRCDVVEFELFKGDGGALRVSALTFPTICRALPLKVDLTPYMEFASLDLASDSSFDDKPIDVLIGLNLYWQFITGNVIRSSNDLMAVESKFRLILSGAVKRSDSCVDATHHTALSNLIIE